MTPQGSPSRAPDPLKPTGGKPDRATGTSESIEAELSRFRILPIVTIEDPATGLPVIDALAAGGIPCAEVTLRTPAGLPALAQIANRRDVLVGAGTVLTVRDADSAIDAGARFLVSPGVSEPVIRRCAQRGVPMIPGVITPSDVTLCLSLGVTLMKLFPAAAGGGIALLDALIGPFPQVRFLPTGGIGMSTAQDYLTRPQVVAVGGSWMIPSAEVAAGRFEAVRALTAQTAQLVSRTDLDQRKQR